MVSIYNYITGKKKNNKDNKGLCRAQHDITAVYIICKVIMST